MSFIEEFTRACACLWGRGSSYRTGLISFGSTSGNCKGVCEHVSEKWNEFSLCHVVCSLY